MLLLCVVVCRSKLEFPKLPKTISPARDDVGVGPFNPDASPNSERVATYTKSRNHGNYSIAFWWNLFMITFLM